MRRNPKSEGRRPKEVRSPKSEGMGMDERCHFVGVELAFGIGLRTSDIGLLSVSGLKRWGLWLRASDFGVHSGFGLRVSDFV